MKKKILIGSALAIVAIACAVPVISTVSASAQGNGISSLVEAIASKFNLNKDEFQKVFDEERTNREAKMQQNFKDKLAQAVTDGKLTQTQADKITAKMAQIKADREANRDKVKAMSESEHKTYMETKRTEMETWAKENNIDTSYLMMGGGRGYGHGRPDSAK